MVESEISSLTKSDSKEHSPEVGGLMRPLSARDDALSRQNDTPTVNSLEKRLKSSDLNYKNKAKKDIY